MQNLLVLAVSLQDKTASHGKPFAATEKSQTAEERVRRMW
jgi:hypothetical protein